MDLVLRRRLGMAYREFTDSQGIVWKVWSTVPTSAAGLAGSFARGWLTFNAGDRLRRLAPIPLDWELVPVDRLEALCDEAQDVARRVAMRERVDRAESEDRHGP